MSETIRTRFAPSPTGFMHVGSVRTALFGWLFARSLNGQFILRIEDTDKSREVEGSIEHILKSLDWLGLDRDEGPTAGGEFGPYIQSERLAIYRSYAEKLIASGQAYADPFTVEQVTEFRKQAMAEKRAFLFRNHRPAETTTPEDWYQKVSLRFKTTTVKRYTWQDEVRGQLSAGEEALDDFVIIKSDGYPTYNFAHIVDDYEMKISHIIRGEEFIASTPKFLSLYEALDIKPPKFVTVPPILNPQGGKKLSKRDGAKDVLAYRAEGYSPEAINNFLSSLGWNDGTTNEIYTTKELIKAFQIKRIQKSGAKFDETKLDWIAWQHTAQEITNNPTDFLQKQGFEDDSINSDFAKLALSKSRSLDEFHNQYKIYSDDKHIKLNSFDLTIIDKDLDINLATTYINESINILNSCTDFSSESIENTLRGKMAELDASPRAYLNLLRWAITNVKVSPNLFEMISILGKDKILERLGKSL